MTWWWFSFADGRLPVGSQLLGGLVLADAPDDFINAVSAAWARGLNPGGEVLGHPIPPENVPRIPARYVGRLLTRPECEAMDREMLS